MLQVHNMCSWCHTVVICVVVVVVTTQWGSLCWQLERCAISERVLTVGGGKLGQSRERERAHSERERNNSRSSRALSCALLSLRVQKHKHLFVCIWLWKRNCAARVKKLYAQLIAFALRLRAFGALSSLSLFLDSFFHVHFTIITNWKQMAALRQWGNGMASLAWHRF